MEKEEDVKARLSATFSLSAAARVAVLVQTPKIPKNTPKPLKLPNIPRNPEKIPKKIPMVKMEDEGEEEVIARLLATFSLSARTS